MPSDRPEVLLRKARQDELALEKLLDDCDIEDDLLGFHAQQAVEKMLKALLAARGVDYPKTHNLRVLIELLAEVDITLPAELAEIDRLTQFGTTFRYDAIPAVEASQRSIWLAWTRALRSFVEPLIRD
jgi:HEPN domain-containing protein